MPTPQQVLEIGESWRPHRSLASLYLWESLAAVPEV
jgi:3-methyladenine DNA glycosylase/8-oxoguanine DNA glycosylase